MIDINKLNDKEKENLLDKIDKGNKYLEFKNVLSKFDNVIDLYKFYYLYVYCDMDFNMSYLNVNNVIVAENINDILLSSLRKMISCHDVLNEISKMTIFTINNKKYFFVYIS